MPKKYSAFGQGDMQLVTDSFVWWLASKEYEMPYTRKNERLKWLWRNGVATLVSAKHPRSTFVLMSGGPWDQAIHLPNNDLLLISRRGHINDLCLVYPELLKPLKDLPHQRKRLSASHQPILENKVSEKISIGTALSPGKHKIHQKIPDSFKMLPPVAFFVDKSEEKPRADLYLINFKAAAISVVPQRWYEKFKGFDPGYTYLVQASYLGNSILGRGMRIGFFELSKDGKKFKRWINKDEFYHIS